MSSVKDMEHYPTELDESVTSSEQGKDSETQEELGFMGNLPIDFLASMFPTLSKESIEAQFEVSGYDFDATLTKLIFSQTEPTKPAPPTTDSSPVSGNPKSNQICRHFAEGKCFRSDCWFRHDLEGTVCKFWLKGGCFNGDSCRFSHEVSPDKIADKIQTLSFNSLPKSPPKKLGKSSFPALNPESPQPSAGFTPLPPKAEGFDRVVKVQKIKDKLPWVPTDIIQHYLGSAWYHELTAYGLLAKRYPKPRDYKPPTVTKPKAPSIRKKPVTFKNIESRIRNILKEPEFLPWINTGATVGQEYQRFREAAAQLARKRNGFFERARASFLGGKMMQAKKLSLEGQELNLQMKEQHRLAARAIIAKRNPSNSTVLDLHCLHISEAIDLLDETIVALRQEARTSSSARPFYLLIGSGHHSTSSQARLLPAVLDFLDSSHIKYRDCSTDGRCGMLRLNL